MITVPAVPARLLQFRGNALHAVPRPADIYWTHQDDPDVPYQAAVDQRSVLLFNIWPIDKGMIVDRDLMNATDNSASIPGEATSNPRSEWKSIQIVSYQEPSLESWLDYVYRLLTNSYYETFLIPLMGNVRRRGTSSRVAQLEGHYGIRDSFQRSHQVTKMIVQPPKQRILGVEL
jgi:hypothetical protein